MNSPVVDINGFCSAKFDRIQEAFVENFREHEELGADFTLIVGGEVVVDM